MVKVITGHSGCGKTTQLLNEAYSKIENNLCLPYEILILTCAINNKEVYRAKHKDLTIWNLEDLTRFILKKTPQLTNKKVISDLIATTIISEFCKNEFAQNSALTALTKSDSFFRDLYNIFGLFKANSITHNELDELINEAELSNTDRERLLLVNEVYRLYNKTLKDNNFLDFRDIETEVYATLKDNEFLASTIKNRFKYIFIDGFENISENQYKLIKLFANENNLTITFDENARIHEFRGALEPEKIKNLFEIEEVKLKETHRNNEILDRALYLVNKFKNKDYDCDFKHTNKLTYKLFHDAHDELQFITDEIINKVKNQNAKFSDFAILIRDSETKQKFVDLFKTFGVPVSANTEDVDFNNFKIVLLRYLEIFKHFQKLGVNDFSTENLKNASLPSKADLEITFDNINSNFEDIITEILTKTHMKDRFLSILENQKRNSLINVVFENLKILTDEDKRKLQEEFNILKQAYKLYLEEKPVELAVLIAQRNKNNFQNKNFIELLGSFTSKTKDIKNLYKEILTKPMNWGVFESVLDSISLKNTKQTNAINLVSMFQINGFEYKYVYVPCLTDTNFPKKNKSTYFISADGNEKISNLIKLHHSNFQKVIEDDKDGIKEETRLFYLGMTSAIESLFLSTHQTQDKKQIQPSIFLEMLIEKESIEKKDIEYKKENNAEFIEIKETEETEKQEEPTFFRENDVLNISFSGIETFQSCPKKYYFKNLLSLKEGGNFSANYGTVAHAIFEIFGQKCINSYTPETILNLSEILFNAKEKPQEALEAGFGQNIIDLIIEADELGLSEMKEQFVEAIDGLVNIGFFNEIPERIDAEKEFNYTLKEIPNVKFTGRIDAIYKYGDEYKIADYKTGKDKKELSYLISENGVNFLTKTGKEPANPEQLQNEYLYQIPIYYFACQNAKELEEYKDKIAKLGLQYVRPKAKDGGSKEDMIQAWNIKEYEEKIIQNLKETVIEKIRQSSNFEQKTNFTTCKNCAFNSICDEEAKDE